ncbi:CRAL TRIO domain containing protein [Asbolus verrucosus]|uniref:CRAL TRIO domain containing protein n=1 Tax=Asbolus verrucosus TaxID=1661398 RepID=A0A482WCV7_ASBVE|nr:CRAL TRIO domain containing protein [Asbolus verrucosus]
MTPKYEFHAEDVIRQGRIRRENLEKLKSWCIAQNLPAMSDEQLILFLLYRYDNVEKAKNVVIGYFKSQKNAPELFYDRNMDAENLTQTIEITMAVMPVRTCTNDVVFFGKLKDTSASNFSFEHTVKLCTMLAEIPLCKDPPDGVVGVADLKGCSLWHLFKIKLSTVQKLLSYLEEGYPCKIKKVHVLNTVGFIDKIIWMLQPFLKKGFLKLFEFHQPDMDMNDFFEKFLAADCCPEDYGGTLPSLESLSAASYQEMRNLQTFYKDEEEQIKSFRL